MLDNSTLNWEDQLPALMIAYNTRVHKSIATTPFFLTSCLDPNLPHFDLDEPRPIYFDDVPTLAYQRAEAAWRKAGLQLKKAEENQLLNAEQTTNERHLKPGQQVLVKPPHTQTGENLTFRQPWQDNFFNIAQAGLVAYLLKKYEYEKTYAHSHR